MMKFTYWLTLAGLLAAGFLGWHLWSNATKTTSATQPAQQIDMQSLFSKMGKLENKLAVNKNASVANEAQSVSSHAESIAASSAPTGQGKPGTGFEMSNVSAIDATTLPQLFEDEPFDELFAQERETNLRDGMLVDDDFQNNHIREIKCKATICRISFVKSKNQMESQDYKELASSISHYLMKNDLGNPQNIIVQEAADTELINVFFTDDGKK